MISNMFSILFFYLIFISKYTEGVVENEGVVDKFDKLLVIAIPTIRADRREAIRETWKQWEDDRVSIIFFTDKNDPEYYNTNEGKDLKNEIETYGDIVEMETDKGMSFGARLYKTMEYMYEHFDFDFYLRLDDDYFLCLDRLLYELDNIKNSLDGIMNLRYEEPSEVQTVPPLMLHSGWRYCKNDYTRIDEAFLLISSVLIHRVLQLENPLCNRFGGDTAARWFQLGGQANKNGDVRWVHYTLIDHQGEIAYLIKNDEYGEKELCKTHMGAHHIYPNAMEFLWSKNKYAPLFLNHNDGINPLLITDKCTSVLGGISSNIYVVKEEQNCNTFQASKKDMWCGKGGC